MYFTFVSMAPTAEPSLSLDCLLNQLDLQAEDPARGADGDEDWSCSRYQSRHPFRTACTLRFMSSSRGSVFALPGRTRNLSRKGVSLLVRRVFALGEPVEIELQLRDRPPMFMTGLVRFCRYTSRGYHEIGVELKSASPRPILSGNPHLAMRERDWLMGVQGRKNPPSVARPAGPGSATAK